MGQCETKSHIYQVSAKITYHKQVSYKVRWHKYSKNLGEVGWTLRLNVCFLVAKTERCQKSVIYFSLSKERKYVISTKRENYSYN